MSKITDLITNKMTYARTATKCYLFMLTFLTKHDMDFTTLSYCHFDFFFAGYIF